MITKVVILGAGGPGCDVLEIIRDINGQSTYDQYECVGFLDNDPDKSGTTVDGIEVRGSVSDAADFDDEIQFVNTIGGPSYFWKVPEIVAESGVERERFETIIHPDAHVADNATIGNGTVVFPKSSIYSSTEIGDHVMIKDARIGHNTTVGDYSSIQGTAMVAGEIGHNCYIGMNSTIRGQVSVGDRSLVGMGAAVVDDVPEGVVVAGVPAEYMRDTTASEDKYVELADQS